jgi:para-nitrobenzyl esterase
MMQGLMFALLLVATHSGQVSGVKVDDTVTAYKGIPYAAPPVGELRWRAPQPVSAWKGERAATDFGPACVQPKSTA